MQKTLHLFTAFTRNRIDTLTASGRLGQAFAIAARSGSILQVSVGKWWVRDRSASRKLLSGLVVARRDGWFAKPLDWATGLGGSNPPLSAPEPNQIGLDRPV